jgi:hypothetical protein
MISPEKFHLLQERVRYLRQVVPADGIIIGPEYMKADYEQ